MNSDTNAERSESAQGSSVGSSLEFENIDSPGAYVFEHSGHLLRVPADAIAPGRSPLMAIDAKHPLRVRKISNDPFITKTKAAMFCASNDIAQDIL